MIVTADHGNIEEKLDEKGNPITAHSLNPVPFCIYDPQIAGEYQIDEDLEDAGISSIAATIIELLGFVPPENYTPSLIQFN
jgi:2,3-bisphosphoglycerate-independent phosphoglycerate mutase